MLPATLLGTCLCLFATLLTSAEANLYDETKWGQEYCHSAYCGLMDGQGHIECCERFKKCCAYAELFIGRINDPFTYEMEKHPRPQVPTTPPRQVPIPRQQTAAPSAAEVEQTSTTVDLGGPIEVFSPSAPASPGHLQAGGRPANLRLPSRDQVKPVTLEDDGRQRSGYRPNNPSKNDVTYQLPTLHHNVHMMRAEEHGRESCRSKFCGVMGANQWYNCCERYKTCCAYVSYHNNPANPFYFEPELYEHN